MIKIEMDEKFFDHLSQSLKNEQASTLDEIAALIQGSIRGKLLSKGIKDTGHLIGSYLSDVKISGNKGIAIVGSNSIYALRMELGIQKRFFPSKTMIESLKGWVRRKLGVSANEVSSVAHKVAWKIARHGLDPTRFPSFAVKEAYDWSSPRVIYVVDRHIRRAFSLVSRFS